MAGTGDLDEVFQELEKQNAAAKDTRPFLERTLPDNRRLATLFETIDVNSPKPEHGMTPLIWSLVHDSPLFHFLIGRGADVNAAGTGDYARAPINIAIELGLEDRAKRLVEIGAVCPPELQTKLDEERRLRQAFEADAKAIERRLSKALKDPAFLSEVARLEAVFGVKAKKTRGRVGHLSFPNVPIKALGEAAGTSGELWLAEQQRAAANKNIGISSREPVGVGRDILRTVAKQEICAAPTVAKREIALISNLGRDQDLIGALQRLEKGDCLADLDRAFPFQLITCGGHGVAGRVDCETIDLKAFAGRLFDLSSELVEEYHGGSPAPFDAAACAEQLAQEIAADNGLFDLPWRADV
ncbi:MAG: hypothetical protein AAFZ05_03905 [Pseudomonadota bacterium]